MPKKFIRKSIRKISKRGGFPMRPLWRKTPRQVLINYLRSVRHMFAKPAKREVSTTNLYTNRNALIV